MTLGKQDVADARRGLLSPAPLFFAASLLLILPVLLPYASDIWRAASGATPVALNLDAVDQQFLSKGEFVLGVRDVGEDTAGTVRLAFTAAAYPLRLDVLYDARQPARTRVVASDAVARGMGPQCLPGALEPLIQREAAEGDKSYLAGVALDLIQSAYDAGRFGGPYVAPWMFVGASIVLLMAAIVAYLVGGPGYPTPDYVPPGNMLRRRVILQARLSALGDRIAALRAENASCEAASIVPTPTTLRDRLAVWKRFQASRSASRMQVRIKVIKQELSKLEQATRTIEDNLAMVEPHLLADRDRFERRLEFWNRATVFGQRASATLAVVALLVSGTFVAVTVTAPTLAMSAPDATPLLLRADTLMATALDANPDLVGPMAAFCNARIMRVTPEDVVVADTLPMAVPTGGSAGIQPPPGTILPQSVQCPIGKPCGAACISRARVCRKDDLRPPGLQCGRGYIAASKRCLIDPGPPLPTAPLNAGATAAPWSTAATPAVTPTPNPQPPSYDGAGSSLGVAGRHSSPPVTTRPTGSPTVTVREYTRSNGTVVPSHERAAPGHGSSQGGRR